MKNHPITEKFFLASVAIAVFAIFGARQLFAQDNAKGEPHKKVIVKIISDDNGTKTIIDTTMEFTGSELSDSVNQEIEKVIELGKNGKHARVKIMGMPKEFKYNFNMPCIPECPMGMEDLEGFEFEGDADGQGMNDFSWDEMPPRLERRLFRAGGHGQSLNDLLGDIPMDRVKNYSVKDTKNGKRIVIDLNDGPLVERQDRVIVIREPGRGQRGMNHLQRKVKVYMNPDDDGKMQQQQEKPAEPGVPSTPPPPPPPASKPEKK
jgi:hypothetical protein